MSYGEGDPSIPVNAQEAHQLAQDQGAHAYLDPDSGYQVFTADNLAAGASCCAKGCRHCPFSRLEQAQAGRPSLRPASA